MQPRVRIRQALSRLFDEPPTHTLARLAQQSVETHLLQQVNPLKLPRLAQLVRQQGLGAHMLHALWAVVTPDRVALDDGARVMSYFQANQEIDRLKNALAQWYDVSLKVPVALFMENRVEYVTSWIALMRLGASAVHASYRFTPSELQYQLEHSGARIIITDTDRLAAARAARDATGEDIAIIVVDPSESRHHDTQNYYELIRRAPDRPTKRPRKTGSTNIVYTSGTTGRPKGAMRDFTSFGPKELSRVIERLDFRAGDRHLIVAPLYHSAGQVFLLLQMALGASIHLLPRFDAEATLRTLSQARINSIFMVPTMLRRVLELDVSMHTRWPTSSLRAIVSGAAPFPTALRERAITRFGASHIFDFYGATELGWVTLIRGDEMLAHPGSVGTPIAGQHVAIFAIDGDAMLEVGEVGVVHVRNGQTMSGYLHDAAATAQTSRDGWVSVEDLGRLDEEGYLYIEGRARDMIISGGVNLYPVEIEERLAKHPSVREVAVFGVPDETWGERVAAAVVLDDGVDTTTIEDYARAHLTGAKVPRRWVQLDELPRNQTGKVLKTSLRELAATEASRS